MMQELKYVKGFAFERDKKQKYSCKPAAISKFAGSRVVLNFDGKGSQVLDFLDGFQVIVDGEGPWDYEALPVSPKICLITVHMLAKETPKYLAYIVDEKTGIVTRLENFITTVEKGSTPLSDTANLVVREFSFGCMENRDCVERHHFTADLNGWILESSGSPGNVVRYYIHCDTKISYFQHQWPLNGNPVDKDGVGYGEAAFLKITDSVYLITFTKHSHGNQPLILWNLDGGNYAANFGGVSRRLHCPFVVTAGGYLRVLEKI
ncbi:MAG: hypothetical protein HFG73_10315 [Hungatella sp.]|nr:hypothetical protein [Hungatella sp.]